MNDFIAGNQDELRWRMMIVTADWVTDEMLDRAVAAASERLGEVPASLRLERLHEGRCRSCMSATTATRRRRSPGGCTVSSRPDTASSPTGTTTRST